MCSSIYKENVLCFCIAGMAMDGAPHATRTPFIHRCQETKKSTKSTFVPTSAGHLLIFVGDVFIRCTASRIIVPQ